VSVLIFVRCPSVLQKLSTMEQVVGELLLERQRAVCSVGNQKTANTAAKWRYIKGGLGTASVLYITCG